MAKTERLLQKRLIIGRRIFEIFDGKEISVSFKNLTKSSESTIRIFDLDPKTERIVRKELSWLIAAVVFTLLSVTGLIEAIEKMALNESLFTLVFLIPGIMCWFNYLQKSYDMIIVKYYNNGEPALYFWNNKPNKSEFERFIQNLIELINNLKVDPRLSPTRRLEIYSQYLQFLCDEDVLSSTEAEQILNRKKKKMKATVVNKDNVVSLVKS